MSPPDEIPFSSIYVGERGRTTYSHIEELAQSIRDNGLIQPIVLVPLGIDYITGDTFGLDAGGRRCRALKLLGVETLYHATTSDPERPGYILKGEKFSSPLQRIMTEIAENLDRDEMDWRDQTKLIVKAYKLSLVEAHASGEHILMRDFGAMVGVEYMQLRAATAIHDDLIANPERYKDVTSIRGAFTKMLKVNEVELTKLQMAKSLQQGPKIVETSSSVSVQSDPEQEDKPKPVEIPITTAFANCDSLDYMEKLSGPTFDHIITDPDYGVSIERLSASVSAASDGVRQLDVNTSLFETRKFIELSWKVVKDQGFLIFWYDLDHHEKLQKLATGVGFMVQRWPLIWVKTDYRSNSAPAYNFTKNIEYAMVCRKPNAVLAQAQNSSVFTCSSGNTVRDFGHPFAKPLDVWRWLYAATTIKGQVIYDPFLGSGSSAVAAVEFGLKPVGSESDEGHYANAIMNLQRCYKKLLGDNVTFS